MNDNIYRQIIIEHYKNPHNFGEIKNPDAQAAKNNPLCGDEMKITVTFNGNKKIKEIKFSGRGCSVSRAGGSILTEIVKGRTVQQLTKYTDKRFLADMAIPITPARKKCALLALVTLREALGIKTEPKSKI